MATGSPDSPGFDRDFDAGGGVVISLTSIREDGRVGVLRQIADQLDIAEAKVAEAEERVSETREMLEQYELTLARWVASRDALYVAHESAKRAFDGD